MAIVVIRTFIVYSVLLITMRLLGKRQLGEMELSEFILASLVADLSSAPLQDIGIPMLNGLAPIAVLFCCELAISGLSTRHIRLRALLFGEPSLLISKGVIDQKELRRNCFTIDELMQELRNHNCMDISQVEYAILETDGSLNVFLFPEFLPASAGQQKLPVENDAYPIVLISAGRVIEKNLHAMGKDEKWLSAQLKAHGAGNAAEVFLMTATRTGKVYFAAKEPKK